ncbi:MAG: thiamine phosphate synthase [Candidatus Omnitrophota bacterium]
MRRDFRVYVILDYGILGRRDIVSEAERIIAAGPDIVQLRWTQGAAPDMGRLIEQARKIRIFARSRKALFVINNRADIALLLDADGLHLGQGDLPISCARKILGRDKIIGVSTHSYRQALAAQAAGADYISVGPVFATPTKPDYKPVGLCLLKRLRNKLRLPFVAIGGIGLNNLDNVLRAGARRVAVARAACCAQDPARLVSAFREKMATTKLCLSI